MGHHFRSGIQLALPALVLLLASCSRETLLSLATEEAPVPAPTVLPTPTPSIPPVTTISGSTITCIDKDADGYGVGPGCLGADADDGDGEITAAADIKTKYPGGTAASDGLSVFLETVKGYHPARYYYVATTGNNATGAANDPTRPFLTISGIRAVHPLAADDIVIVRGGTYTDNWTLAYPTTSGNAGHPIIVMAYPGEKPIWDLAADWGGEPTVGNHHLVFDGLNFTNSATGMGRTYRFGGDGGGGTSNIVIRNSEVWRRANGVFAMQGLRNWVIENNVFHDTVDSHGIYLGARGLPNSDLTLRGNVIYKVGLTCIQHNGRVTRLLMDGNTCYAYSNATGFALEMGASNSRLVNNLCFNGLRSCLTIYDYPSPPSMPEILPYDQTGNIIENNTFIIGSRRWDDGTALISGSPAISFGLFTQEQTQDIWHNTVRNNILVTQNGIPPIHISSGRATYSCQVAGSCTGSDYKVNGTDPTAWAKLITIENNLIFNSSGTSIMRVTNVLGPTNAAAAPGPIPPSVNTILNWNQFGTFSSTYVNNLNADPKFVSSNPEMAMTPSEFSFALQPGSPAKGASTPSGGVATDIRGVTRSNPPSIGAYE